MRKISVLLLGALILSGCGKQDPEKPESPRIVVEKSTSLVTPKINQEVVLGESINVSLSSAGEAIDSVILVSGGKKQVFKSSQFKWVPNTSRTGIFKPQLEVYCAGQKENHHPRLKMLSDVTPEGYSYVVLGAYPHNTEDFTQGLFFLDDNLIESTGQKGESLIRKYELANGQTIKSVPIDDQYFGEGSTQMKDEIFQITWQSRVGFVYDLELNQKRSFQYDTEGWGLTTIGDSLVMSDGTEKIYFIEPSNFSEIGRIEVYDNEGPVTNLNELEYINGLIYANEWQTDNIQVIDPNTGKVLKTIDMSGLLSAEESRKADVLNGIAYDKPNDRLLVTGKLWPWLFEIKLQPKNSDI